MCSSSSADYSDYVFCLSKACFFTGLVSLISLYFLIKHLIKQRDQRKFEAFANTPKDTVIIHAFPRVNFPSNLHTPQPWVLKIELFCKLANIKYVIDTTQPWGPVGGNMFGGKSPWITLNGQHMGDSQLIIEFLQRKFNVKEVFGKYKEEELAVARAVRVMLEERFFWAMPFWRFIWDEGKSHFYRDWSCLKLTYLPFYDPFWFFRWRYSYGLGQQAKMHGVGLHSKEDIKAMMCGDLRGASQILGEKRYILGDKPCMEDCAIFGSIAQAVYGMPASPYDKLIDDELPNLREYCRRIKEEYYPEWKF